jgi:hypothetical protein
MAEYKLDIIASTDGFVKGLENAQEGLLEVGQAAIKAGEDAKKAFSDTGGQEKFQRSLREQFLFLGKTEVELKKIQVQLKKTFDPAATAELNKQLKTVTDSLIKFDAESEKSVTIQKSLKNQLRENKAVLAEMEEQGLETTESFFKLQVQTGKLQDQINDTNERIKFFASDTKGLDGLIGVTKLATAGFAVGQGAAALFGAENENVQKALLKVNAAMAILNGLQEIQQALQKSSAARITLETAARKIKIFFLGAETVATEGLTTAQIAAANAARILRAALIATGIGAVVALLVLAADAMGAFDDATQDATKSIEEQKKSLEDFQTFLDKQTQIDIIRAKRKGATEDEIREIEHKARLKDIKVIENDINKLNEAIEKGARDKELSLEDFNKLRERRDELRAKAQAISDADEIAQEQRTTDRILKVNQDLEKADEEALKKKATRLTKETEILKAAAIKKLEMQADLFKKLDRQAFEAASGSGKAFRGLFVTPDDDVEGQLQMLDKLQQIKEFELDIEFESGEKSLAEAKRIAQLKLEVEIEFAEKKLELLRAAGGDVGQIRAIELAVVKAKNQIKELGDEGDNSDFLKAIGLGEISAEELAGIKSNLKIVVDSIKSIVGTMFDEAIERNQDSISRLDGQIEKVRENIQREDRLNQEGRANNLKQEQENLNRLENERRQAFERDKKLQRQKLNLDAAVQISSLIVAAANIYEATSSAGPIGVAVAVAAIAAMFAAFTLNQIEARKTLNNQSFREGGEVQGKRHEQGGEKYYSQDGNLVEIEAGEYVVKRPMAKKYRQILEAVNTDNLQSLLSGTGVGLLSDSKIDSYKQAKQSFANGEIKYRVDMENAQGNKETKALRQDFNKFAEKLQSKKETTYQDGWKIEKRGNRTIRTKL